MNVKRSLKAQYINKLPHHIAGYSTIEKYKYRKKAHAPFPNVVYHSEP